MRFDRRRLQQVILNLLSNAVKFQSKGVINVHSYMSLFDDDSFFEVSVQDQGIGMTKSEAANVFAPINLKKRNQELRQVNNGIGL